MTDSRNVNETGKLQDRVTGKETMIIAAVTAVKSDKKM